MVDDRTQLGTPLGVPAVLLGGAGLALALPGLRTASFMASTVRRHVSGDGEPTADPESVPGAPRPSVRLAGLVAVDEAVRALMLGMARAPSASHRRRIRAEVEAAEALYEERGWLEDPYTFHRRPYELRSPRVTSVRARGLDFEHVRFDSGYEPRQGEPGRDRWLALSSNRTAHAWVLRHRGRDNADRPWLICIPGFRMGQPGTDLAGLRAAYHHYRLGLNVMIPVLPLHGPRRIGARSGDGFITTDALNTVHAEAQAMWDLRRLLDWTRSQGTSAVGAYGVSLGGYNTALLASLDGDLDCAIAGIPASCFPSLLRIHLPGPLRWLGTQLGIEWDALEKILRVVSPRALKPRVPLERRYMFGGLADRLVPPEHVHKLWEHWERPRIAWYHGTHLSFHFDRDVRALMHDAYIESGLTVTGRD